MIHGIHKQQWTSGSAKSMFITTSQSLFFSLASVQKSTLMLNANWNGMKFWNAWVLAFLSRLSEFSTPYVPSNKLEWLWQYFELCKLPHYMYWWERLLFRLYSALTWVLLDVKLAIWDQSSFQTASTPCLDKWVLWLMLDLDPWNRTCLFLK